MVLELVLGFLFLVAASYVGTTMALRGFFGRERYDRASKGPDVPPEAGRPERDDDVPRASDVSSDESDE